MRARSATMAGVTRVTLLIVGGLTACTAAPDSGSLPGSGEAAQRSPQQPPPAAAPPPTPTLPAEVANASPHPYVGMWATADGHIRQELLANGRYDEARGDRENAYTGPHQVSGTRIEYVDETGFSADGTFDGDVLRHGGHILYREGGNAHRRNRGQRQ
ncbi:protein Atu4866 [Streptomyces radiopugnans]|uniref:Protein Atu4866 n=1 Tax=Streptomyces radiopugnans TaxID=403935 RepID=A0A1H9DDN0_9ACTN|nr:protein Atu4866 [Streptomyces radiopugnans]SEQ98041.1 protein Atu4866 [Streptomyces radiopugnans]